MKKQSHTCQVAGLSRVGGGRMPSPITTPKGEILYTKNFATVTLFHHLG